MWVENKFNFITGATTKLYQKLNKEIPSFMQFPAAYYMKTRYLVSLGIGDTGPLGDHFPGNLSSQIIVSIYGKI